jgi:hyperosmotically inducible protein
MIGSNRKRSASARALCAFSLGVILVLALPGCQTYRDGEGRTVGEVTDDVAIQTAVKSRLLADPDVSGLRIQTEVYRGVVTLYGRVPDEPSRRLALRIAEEVKGVVRVDDRLTIVTE